jgi:hypothetical protein
MSADVPTPLTKVDSAVQGLASSPPKEKRRASSSVPGVYNINDLGMSLHSTPTSSAAIRRRSSRLNPIDIKTDANRDIEKEGTELQIAKETQKLNWYVCTYNRKCLTLPRTNFEHLIQPYDCESEYVLTQLFD